MARPEAEIDWNRVDEYLKAQCEGTTIADVLGIHPNTLYRHCEETHKVSFSEYSRQKKAEGREALRAKQYNVAMTGDKTLLVWLGKQYLGQRDKSDININDAARELEDALGSITDEGVDSLQPESEAGGEAGSADDVGRIPTDTDGNDGRTDLDPPAEAATGSSE